MQLMILQADAKLKGNMLQEEEKQQRSRSLELGRGDPGKHDCCTQAVNQTITRSKGTPLTNDPTPPYPPLAQQAGGKANPGPTQGLLDKRGRSSVSSLAQVS